MRDVGVSDMAIYIPPFYLSHEDLARARGIPPEKYHMGLGNHSIAIIPNWEDAVTMAANAVVQGRRSPDYWQAEKDWIAGDYIRITETGFNRVKNSLGI